MQDIPIDAWKARVWMLRILYYLFLVITMNFHVVVFYLNFRNIRIISPFSLFWDYALIFTQIATSVTLVVWSYVGHLQYGVMVLSWGIMFINTVLFHIMAIYFLHNLSKFTTLRRKSRSRRQTSLASVSPALHFSMGKVGQERDSSLQVYRSLILFAMSFWVSIAVWVAGFALLLTSPNMWNVAILVLRISSLFAPLQLNFTLAFVSAVSKLMKSLTGPPNWNSGDLPLKSINTNSTTLNTDGVFLMEENSQAAPETPVGTPSNDVLPLLQNHTVYTNENISNNVMPQYPPIGYNESKTRMNFEPYGNPVSNFEPTEIKYIPPPTFQMPLTPTDLSPPQTKTEYGLLTVIKPYWEISRSDEIVLNVGDQVDVEIQFKDGWALGYNRNTKKHGYFPLQNCVPPSNTNSPNPSTISKPDTTANLEQRNSQRISVLSVSAAHISGSLLPRSNSLLENQRKSQKHNSAGSPPPIPLPTINVEDIQNSPTNDSLMAPVSSIASEMVNYMEVTIASPATPAKSELQAIYPYDPKREDELLVVPGYRIILERTFTDGWGFGRLDESYGYFPLSSCVVLSTPKS
ncbi:hypothetical protein HK098_007134 [Nowakowskiella sp. JEL0407]|nr:hypothetical protein HK098_007134 [Nowakowskiella sp. JEL0407]